VVKGSPGEFLDALKPTKILETLQKSILPTRRELLVLRIFGIDRGWKIKRLACFTFYVVTCYNFYIVNLNTFKRTGIFQIFAGNARTYTMDTIQNCDSYTELYSYIELYII
jgi:hypothetical protein